MGLHEIRVEVNAGCADEIDGVLLELGLACWSLHEDAIAKRAWVVGIFEEEAEARASWEDLRPLLPGEIPLSPELRPLADRDWRDSYKAHFKPWQFGRLHWVPVWERETFRAPTGDEVLWLDPGLAFGTGNHETTRLCVERLVKLAEGESRNRVVIDAGCGSGILALSAALLGFSEVVAFDNDAEAVRVSQENAALNNLGGRVQFLSADLLTGLAGRKAGILLANIQADVLVRFAAELVAAVAPGGTLVLSGILAVERDATRHSFEAVARGWNCESRILGEWSDLMLSRPTAQS